MVYGTEIAQIFNHINILQDTPENEGSAYFIEHNPYIHGRWIEGYSYKDGVTPFKCCDKFTAFIPFEILTTGRPEVRGYKIEILHFCDDRDQKQNAIIKEETHLVPNFYL